MKKKKFWKWFKLILLIYIGIGILLYAFQKKLLFHPESLPSTYQYNFTVPFHEINIPVNKDKNISIVQFTVPDSLRKGIVLYFHGNMKNINRYAPFATNFTNNNYDVWMIDYPGFGKSTGKLTEQAIYQDALEMYRMAIRTVAADSIIIYGKSLGSGIAAQLASIRDCKRLILETPYYSIESLAKHYVLIYPFMPTPKFAFPTYEYIQHVAAPITIFHGTSDGVIPYAQAKRLVKNKSSIQFVTIEKGGHNNLNDFPLFHQQLDLLLK